MGDHTPGPWKVRSPIGGVHKGYPYQITTDASPSQNITSWGGISRRASPEGLANARLMASAPDLLEALNKILADVAWHNMQPETLAAARAAHAKATGQ